MLRRFADPTFVFDKPSRQPQRVCRTLLAAVALMFATFAYAAPASAGKGEASRFLENLAGEAIAVLSAPGIGPQSRQRAFRRLIHRGFDFSTVSRFVLGRHWQRASEAERSEFMRLFEDYTVVSYARRLGNYSGESLHILGERAINANTTQVASRITLNKRAPINIDWRLSRRSGHWRIVDVVVEGVSLAMVQRAEFNSVIRRGGGRLAGLLTLMEKKVAAGQPTRTASN
jgi:phospholipid transport system substrate-binding protein